MVALEQEGLAVPMELAALNDHTAGRERADVADLRAGTSVGGRENAGQTALGWLVLPLPDV